MDCYNLLNYILIGMILIVTFSILHKKFKKNKKPAVLPEESIRTESFDDKQVTYAEKVNEKLTQDYESIDGAGCRLKEIDEDVESYISKNLLNGGDESCPQKIKTAAEFNNSFFNFRDKIYNNSSMTVDPVDKVLDLYMSGNLDQSRRLANMKIKDIFDYATYGTNLYEKHCVRMPKFDDINYDGYKFKPGVSTTNMSLVRDDWKYEKEHVLNGGEVRDGIYPYDQNGSNLFPKF